MRPIMLLVVLLIGCQATYCPDHCTSDYEGDYNCHMNGTSVSLKAVKYFRIGSILSTLLIKCQGTNFTCSDLPLFDSLNLEAVLTELCPPRILRCLTYILGDPNIKEITLTDPNEALTSEDLTDFLNVTRFQIQLSDGDTFTNIDIINNLPHLKTAYIVGGNVQLRPNSFDNKSLKQLIFDGCRFKNIPVGAFNGLSSLQYLRFSYSTIEDLDIKAGAFKGLTPLLALYFIETGVKSIEHETFLDTPQLVVLELRENLINNLPNMFFQHLGNLRTMYLKCASSTPDRSVMNLGTQAFANLPSLRKVDLESCNLNDLSAELFSNSHLISDIYISSSDIHKITSNIFTNLTSLYSLGLYNNEMQEIPEGLFANLSSLYSLSLNNNSIIKLQSNWFHSLTSLNRLNLEDNKIKTLPEGVFATLNALKELLLNGNNIQSMPNNIFSNLVHLTTLDLSNNSIHEIPQGIFSTLTSLQTLKLQSNYIKKLHYDIFDSLTSLQYLNLAKNKLSELPSFHSLSNLELLDLSNNEVTHLTMNIFVGLSHIYELNLSNNQITTIDANEMESGAAAFTPINTVQYLDLSGNRLQKLYTNWIFDLHGARILNLSNNHFTDFQQFQVDYTNLTIGIDLQYNQISEVVLDQQKSHKNYTRHDTTSVIWLNHNPITCNCNTEGLIRRAKERRLNYNPRFIVEDTRCAAPRSSKGTLLKDIQPIDLGCPVNSSSRNHSFI